MKLKLTKKTNSIKKNFFFNLLLTLSNIIFPIISFPYASNILGPYGIGKVQFVNSFLQYFVFLASLGIPIYGIRIIAKEKENFIKLKKIFSDLLIINVISTFFFFFLFLLIIFFVPSLYIDIEFYLVGSVLLIVSFCNVDWFFSGIERFQYIAIRSIIVKILFLFILYFVVSNKDDVVPYLWVTIGATVVNNLWNIFSARSFFTLKYFFLVDLKEHIKPLLLIFSSVIAASVYSSLDVLILGFLKGFNDVGFYTAGAKIIRMCIPFLTAMSLVLMPQITQSFSNKNFERVNFLIAESFKFIIILGVPSVIGLIVLAPEIIYVFSGSQFLPAIISMQLMAPVVLIIGLSTVFSIQILSPAAKYEQGTITVFCGLGVSLVLNFILIPEYGYIGATISNLFSEFAVMCVYGYFASKIINLSFEFKLFFQCIFTSIFFIPLKYLIKSYISSEELLVLIIGILFSAIWYLLFTIFVFKNEFVKRHFLNILNKITLTYEKIFNYNH